MSHLDPSAAERILREAGARVTQPRVRVLAILLASPHALTHLEVESKLTRARAVDRVTVYRVLEWLVARRLAHRIADGDRIWRFNAVAHRAGEHAHFKCNGCSRVVCLERAALRRVALPAGYRPDSVEITVQGLCAECLLPGAEARARARVSNP